MSGTATNNNENCLLDSHYNDFSHLISKFNNLNSTARVLASQETFEQRIPFIPIDELPEGSVTSSQSSFSTPLPPQGTIHNVNVLNNSQQASHAPLITPAAESAPIHSSQPISQLLEEKVLVNQQPITESIMPSLFLEEEITQTISTSSSSEVDYIGKFQEKRAQQYSIETKTVPPIQSKITNSNKESLLSNPVLIGSVIGVVGLLGLSYYLDNTKPKEPMSKDSKAGIHDNQVASSSNEDVVSKKDNTYQPKIMNTSFSKAQPKSQYTLNKKSIAKKQASPTNKSVNPYQEKVKKAASASTIQKSPYTTISKPPTISSTPYTVSSTNTSLTSEALSANDIPIAISPPHHGNLREAFLPNDAKTVFRSPY